MGYHGLENIEVAKFMLGNRGVNQGFIITESCVHNTPCIWM